MITASMRAAKAITEGRLDHPTTISTILKLSSDLIKEATDLTASINHLQGRSSYKIDNPTIGTGLGEVPKEFFEDERITTQMLIEQYLEYQKVYATLLKMEVRLIS